jgi:hypothetical protein
VFKRIIQTEDQQVKNDSNSHAARRTLLVSISLASLGFHSVAASQDNKVAFEFRVPTQLLVELKKDTNFPQMSVSGDPGSVDPTKGLPLIYIAAGVLAIPELARSLLALYRDFKHGGTIIEVRSGKIVITHDSRLDADTIVVKDSTGKITVHRNRTAATVDEWVKLLGATKK